MSSAHAHAPAIWPADRDFGLVRPAKLAMWITLLSDWLGFFALLLAYGILRVNSVVWRHTGEPSPGIPVAAVLTLVLAVSSICIIRAFDDSVAGNRQGTARWLLFTGVCGLIFLIGQKLEWSKLTDAGLIFGQTAYASTFYVITGFHMLPVLAGLIWLGFILVRNSKGVTTPNEIQLFELFWLFVYFGWNFVFVILYLLPSGGA